jgi:dTDP-4-amino-4,6-dideoxygalactose transaminase
MNVPFTNLYQQYLDCSVEINQAIADSVVNSSFITGPDTTKFEKAFAKFTGAEDCAATGSGTTALLCAMRALGIGPGDQVLTTPHTFVATTEAIVSVGATPVFVDIDPLTHLINLDELESKITTATKAVMSVDIYGQCPNMDRLREICKRYNLYLVEDAAHSITNLWKQEPVGSMADITCFSFNPVKNLGAMGDAGACTGSSELMERVRMYRDHGRTGRYEIKEIGYNARIDNMQANIILAKLPYLKDWMLRKRRLCNFYTDQLRNYVQIPKIELGNTHSYYVYVIQTPRRDELAAHLKNMGIATNIHYATTVHQQPAFAQWYSACPVAEKTVKEILSLPCWYSMSENEISYVVDQVKAFAQ